MRILLISKDKRLQSYIKDFEENCNASTIIYNDEPNPIKILSFYLSIQPSAIIVDDDYLTPNSVTFIESVRKVNQKTKIIFTTSDSSIELGKQISPLGIYYYIIKPIDEREFKELLDSLLISKTKQYNQPLQ